MSEKLANKGGLKAVTNALKGWPNFNRQFKKIKNITPTEFQNRVNNGISIPVRTDCY